MFKQTAQCYAEGPRKRQSNFLSAVRDIFILRTLNPEASYKWNWWTNTWDTSTPGNTGERGPCISWKQCQRSQLQILQALASKHPKKTKSKTSTAPLLGKKHIVSTKNLLFFQPVLLLFFSQQIKVYLNAMLNRRASAGAPTQAAASVQHC